MKFNGLEIAKMMFNGSSIAKALFNGANVLNKIIVFDSFNRANNASSLGNTETGQAWSSINAGVWGISDNKAYVSSGTGVACIAVSNSINSNAIISVDTVYKSSTLSGIIFRCDGSDANRLLFKISESSNEVQLIKKVDGVAVTVAVTPFTKVIDQIYNLKVVQNGNSVKCYIDDIEKISVTLSDLIDNTYHGIVAYRVGAVPTTTYDNFKVEAI